MSAAFLKGVHHFHGDRKMLELLSQCRVFIFHPYELPSLEYLIIIPEFDEVYPGTVLCRVRIVEELVPERVHR